MVRDFFTRLMQTRNESLRITVIGMMAGHQFPVADSLLLHLAAMTGTAVNYDNQLGKGWCNEYLPRAYRTQEWLARSELMSEHVFDRMDSISLLVSNADHGQRCSGPGLFFSNTGRNLGIHGSWVSAVFNQVTFLKVSAGKSIVSLTDTRII